MLGIIIGVAAVITMVALGAGAQRAVNEQLDSLGGNILSVSVDYFLAITTSLIGVIFKLQKENVGDFKLPLFNYSFL
jgi:ABC-type antimicrobial peptide transport system permease subunit